MLESYASSLSALRGRRREKGHVLEGGSEWIAEAISTAGASRPARPEAGEWFTFNAGTPAAGGAG